MNPTHTPEPPEPPMTLADDALNGDFTPIDGDQSDLMAIGMDNVASMGRATCRHTPRHSRDRRGS